MTTTHRERRATLVGMGAVAMWATLALLTARAGAVPPFQLVAMSFTIASGLALVWWLAHGRTRGTFPHLSPAGWALGVGGLFGYHFFYFTALQNAPVVEASLIAYLWPLLSCCSRPCCRAAQVAPDCAGSTPRAPRWVWPAPP